MTWGRIDSRWVIEKGLKGLTAGNFEGEHIAALKVLLTIGAYVDYSTNKSTLSLTDFQEVTGLSRPQVLKGIRRLQELEVIEKDASGHIHTYKLHISDAGRWAKVPKGKITNDLSSLPNKGSSALAALKILVLLLVLRSPRDNLSNIGHLKIVEYTNIATNKVKAGIDHLINHRFIHIHHVDAPSKGEGRYSNSYRLLGNFTGFSKDEGSRDSRRPVEAMREDRKLKKALDEQGRSVMPQHLYSRISR